MGRCRWVVFSALAALWIALPAPAQDAGKLAQLPPGVRAGIQTEFMAKKLSLSPQQREQVQAINQKYAEQMQPILEGSSGPLARMREVKQVEDAKEADLRGVLNPEQFQGYLAAKEEMRQHVEQKAMESRAGKQ